MVGRQVAVEEHIDRWLAAGQRGARVLHMDLREVEIRSRRRNLNQGRTPRLLLFKLDVFVHVYYWLRIGDTGFVTEVNVVWIVQGGNRLLLNSYVSFANVEDS